MHKYLLLERGELAVKCRRHIVAVLVIKACANAARVRGSFIRIIFKWFAIYALAGAAGCAGNLNPDA